MVKFFYFLCLFPLLGNCQQNENQNKKEMKDWKSKLSEEEYRVTRMKGTERAFTGKYWDNKEEGIYTCVCCKNPLFSSQSKFDSGTGWPSFSAVISKNQVKEITDNSHGMSRTEVLCKNCDAHLGHVFNDGPKPTGLRYCINSVSLSFEKKKK